MISLPLESELQVVRLKRYLDKYPDTAMELAVQHYEDFLALAIEHRKLKAQLKAEVVTVDSLSNLQA